LVGRGLAFGDSKTLQKYLGWDPDSRTILRERLFRRPAQFPLVGLLVVDGVVRTVARNYFNPHFLSQLWRFASVVW
jgi:hypothetical protein